MRQNQVKDAKEKLSEFAFKSKEEYYEFFRKNVNYIPAISRYDIPIPDILDIGLIFLDEFYVVLNDKKIKCEFIKEGIQSSDNSIYFKIKSRVVVENYNDISIEALVDFIGCCWSIDITFKNKNDIFLISFKDEDIKKGEDKLRKRIKNKIIQGFKFLDKEKI